ncbi:MAG TPA: hypothetical protein VIM52_13235 [Stellaceae bacterium]
MSEPEDLLAAGSAAEPQAPAAPRYRRIAIAVAGAVLLVGAVVASAPFWAPLLPWAPAPAHPDATPAGPIAAPAPPQAQAPPQSPPPQSQPEAATADTALQQLDRRVGALEARPAAPASDIADIRREVARLTGSATDLDARVAAIDKARSAQSAVDATDMALVLALLQIRGALDVGRPFAAEYEALAALARTRPEVAAAAAPLAEPAKTGIASRAVLANRLRELAGAIASAKAPENAPAEAPANPTGAAPDWADRALMRLRGLVTIRRIDGAGQGQPDSGPASVVNAAELALAGGDLEGALGALDRLTGAAAETARPWLRMAKERALVEAALDRIEAFLVARLGAPAGAAPAAGSPR